MSGAARSYSVSDVSGFGGSWWFSALEPADKPVGDVSVQTKLFIFFKTSTLSKKTIDITDF
jgi:hypothetical protein